MKIKWNLRLIASVLIGATVVQGVYAETKGECHNKCWNRYNNGIETCDANSMQDVGLCIVFCLPAAPSGIGYLACVGVCDLNALVNRNRCYTATEAAYDDCMADCPQE